MKLAVIRAGSTYTPEVIDGLVRHLLGLDRHDRAWPVSIVHEHDDTQILVAP